MRRLGEVLRCHNESHTFSIEAPFFSCVVSEIQFCVKEAQVCIRCHDAGEIGERCKKV